MNKHQSKEAFYQRLQQLAEVKKPVTKESRNLGTLIDYKRAADGVAYGIIKEQHHYYLKKAGTKQNPSAADFAYIGGLENITEFQYKKLSEADKHRSMILHTINEAITLRPDKNGSKKKLNEDKAEAEIDAAAEKVDDLDAATDAAAEPEVADDGGEGEMAAGLEAEPAGEEMPATDGGEEMPMDGEEAPEGEEGIPASDGGEEAPEGEEGIPASDGGEEGEAESQLQKDVSQIADEIKDTEMDGGTIKWVLKRFLQAFLPEKEEEMNEEESKGESKMAELDIDDRKEIADMILNVVSPEDVQGLEKNVEDTEARAEAGLEEEECSECGGFGAYAESRGYTKDSIQECGEEELGSVVSGYANAYNDGQNDGDFKMVALLITPEMLEKLKGEYGHDEYAEKLSPYVGDMNECKLEERQAQINELWGGLKNLGQAAASGVKGAVQKGAEKIGQTYQAGKEKVGQAVTGIKQTYHKGEVPAEVKKLEQQANDLGKQIAALNSRLQKAGQQPVNVQSLLTTIKNQLTGTAGTTNLGKYGAVAEGDVANVVTQPNMLKEDDEPEPEEIEKDEIGGEEETGEVEVPEIDDAGEEGSIFAADATNLGGGVVKPDGAGVEIEITPDKTVKIEMSESEVRLRKYIRERLEVKAGLKKEKLHENKKSPTLKKLDVLIDQQFKLYEGAVKKK